MGPKRTIKEPIGLGGVLVLAFFPLVFIVGGSVLAYASWQHREWAKESPSWPQVPGRIVRITRSGTSRTITYAYGAGGKFYQTNRAVLGSITPGEQRELAEGLFAGQDVMVHVHPDDPTLSVLFPGARASSLGMPITGAAGILFGLAIAWYMWKSAQMDEG